MTEAKRIRDEEEELRNRERLKYEQEIAELESKALLEKEKHRKKQLQLESENLRKHEQTEVFKNDEKAIAYSTACAANMATVTDLLTRKKEHEQQLKKGLDDIAKKHQLHEEQELAEYKKSGHYTKNDDVTEFAEKSSVLSLQETSNSPVTKSSRRCLFESKIEATGEVEFTNLPRTSSPIKKFGDDMSVQEDLELSGRSVNWRLGYESSSNDSSQMTVEEADDSENEQVSNSFSHMSVTDGETESQDTELPTGRYVRPIDFDPIEDKDTTMNEQADITSSSTASKGETLAAKVNALITSEKKKKKNKKWAKPLKRNLNSNRISQADLLHYAEEANVNKQLSTAKEQVDYKPGELYAYRIEPSPIKHHDSGSWERNKTKIFPGMSRSFYIPHYSTKDAGLKKTITKCTQSNVTLVHYYGKSLKQEIAHKDGGSASSSPTKTKKQSPNQKTNSPAKVQGFAASKLNRRHMRQKPKSAAAVNQNVEIMSNKTAVKIMKACKKENTLELAEFKVCTEPKAGNVYVFDVSKYKQTTLRTVKHDGSRWAKKNTIPVTDDVSRTTYYVMDEDNQQNPGFKKFIFHNPKDDVALVHYVGDDTLSAPLPHKNATRDQRPFIPQSTHVADDVKSLGKLPPKQVYNALHSNTGPGLSGIIPTPRNRRAIRHIQQKEKEANNISGSEEEKVKSLHKYLGPYNRMSSYVPHTTVVLINDENIKQYEKVAKIAQEKNLKIEHHFDTTVC
jgi:hypothetical protein